VERRKAADLVFREVAIVEDQKELGAVLESLEVMRDSGREEPNV